MFLITVITVGSLGRGFGTQAPPGSPRICDSISIGPSRIGDRLARSHHAEKPLAFAAVRYIEAGNRWYKMLLGRDPETQPMAGLAEW
jgi:hypothetical protein